MQATRLWIVFAPSLSPETSLDSVINLSLPCTDTQEEVYRLAGYVSYWIVVGYIIAKIWKASELQPSYAPELDIAGVALGGLYPNVTYLTGLNTRPVICVKLT